MTTEHVHQPAKASSELLDQYRAENLRLTADNLRLRTQRQKIKSAFAKFVGVAFVKLNAARAPRIHRESA